MTRYFCFELLDGTPIKAYPKAYPTRDDAKKAHPKSKVVGVTSTFAKPRSPYRWGKTEDLVKMDVGEMRTFPYVSESNYGAWRSIASTLKSIADICFKVMRRGDDILITRVK